MKTTITHPTDTTVYVTISLDKDDLHDAEQVALHKIAKTLKVAGFRKGKVPINVAAKSADPRVVADETVEAAISKAVAKTFVDNNLQALDRPAVELKKFVPGELLECTAEVEILPAVKLGDYKKLKATVKPEKVEASDVEDVIERMRAGFSEKEAVEREAKLGDDAVIDFVGKKDDVAFPGGTGSDYSLALGSNTFIPGFEEGIVGHKIGETFDLKLKFPADYHVADLKGQDVVFTTTLKSLTEKKLPEVNDDFAAKAGPFKTVKELKDDILRELTEQREREAKEKTKDALVGELIKVSKVPVPEILVNDQMQSIEQDFHQNLMYQGMVLDQYIETQGFDSVEDWKEKEVKPTAVKRVQAGLALAELSKELKVEATSDELADYINRYRMQYANNPEVVKQFEQPEVQRDLANRLLTDKTVDLLLELNSK